MRMGAARLRAGFEADGRVSMSPGVALMSEKSPQGTARNTTGTSAAPLKVPQVCSVLVADDEHLIATSIAAMAREMGHNVTGVAGDGEAAVHLARQSRPDVALLDIRMPKLSGIDVAAVLYRELSVPSVIISAYSDQEQLDKIRQNGVSGGIYGYLIKPVEADDLRVALGVALVRSATDHALSDRVEQLERNVANRRVVEQAKWVLVQKRQLTEPQAHEKLQKLARDQRRPLAEIAGEVIQRGDLPGA